MMQGEFEITLRMVHRIPSNNIYRHYDTTSQSFPQGRLDRENSS